MVLNSRMWYRRLFTSISDTFQSANIDQILNCDMMVMRKQNGEEYRFVFG